MFVVRDTFNGAVVSRHHSLLRAVQSEERYSRGVAKRGGSPHVSVFDEDGDLGSQDHLLNWQYEGARCS